MLTIFEDTEDDAPQIRAFVELVIKLNEASFKPLYRIMFDWAWTADDVSTVFSQEHRAIAYCQAMGAIQGMLKVFIYHKDGGYLIVCRAWSRHIWPL